MMRVRISLTLELSVGVLIVPYWLKSCHCGSALGNY